MSPDTFDGATGFDMRFSVLAIGVLLVAGAAALATLPSVLTSPGSDGIVFAVATTTAIGGAVLLAWRDLYAFGVFAALLALVVLAGVGLAASIGPVTPALLVLALVATLVLIVCAVFIGRTQLGKAVVPDVLAQRFGRAAVYETGGVQVAGVVAGSVPANAISPIDVYLQNCTLGERTVDVSLDDTPLLGRGGKIRWRKPAPVVLAPSEVKVVRIPICATRTDASSASLHFVVKASGPPAKRVRPRRAPYAAPPLPRWQIALIVLLALPLFVVIVWGRGGLQASVHFTPASPVREEDELPEPTVESLWRAES